MVQGWRPAPLPLVPGSRPRPGSGFLGHQHPNPRQPPGPSQDSAPPVHGQSRALSGHCPAQATARGAGSLPSGCTPHGPSHTQRVHACPGSWASPELQPGPGQERHPLLWPSLSGPPLGLTRSRPRARVSGQARHSGIGTRHAGALPRLAPEAPRLWPEPGSGRCCQHPVWTGVGAHGFRRVSGPLVPRSHSGISRVLRGLVAAVSGGIGLSRHYRSSHGTGCPGLTP